MEADELSTDRYLLFRIDDIYEVKKKKTIDTIFTIIHNLQLIVEC